jgi:hypothetical protein
MRGSPLFRTLIVLGVLLLTGLALARLTREVRPVPAAPPPGEAVSSSAAAAKSANYELVLSAPAAELTLEAGGKPSTALSGALEITGETPVISLRIKWADNSPGHRFAKLRLEIPGKDTLEHVFSAPGDIDDIWEP